MMTERGLLKNGTKGHDRKVGTLPHLRRENPHKNQTGHGGEKPYCVLPEVQEGISGGYKGFGG